MKIYADSSDQTLICLDYDFSQDCPAHRDVARRLFGRGIELKGQWNYKHAHKGLRVLVAYEGPRAVGQVEYLPIAYAPRPVAGNDLMFINCLVVAPAAQGRGTGRALLEACETEARQHAAGLAVLGHSAGPFMPAEFFARHGFGAVAQADGTQLMYKTWAEARPPEYMPRQYTPALQPGQVMVDYFWCGQCPYAVRTRDRLKHVAGQMGQRVVLREINTDDRDTVAQWGVADGFFINGRSAFGFPPTPSEAQIRAALEQALGANQRQVPQSRSWSR